MSIAEDKKENNIIEYILYLWKMEQLARGVNFDISVLENFLRGSIKDEAKLQEEVKWSNSFFKQMKDQRIQETGHVNEVQEILVELHYLHTTLFDIIKDQKYIDKFNEAKPLIKEFNDKANKNESSDVQAMIKALNAFLTLKISGKEISINTQDAITLFSSILGILASRYKLMKKGELNVNLN